MDVQVYIQRSLPFLKLGKAIASYHDAKYPDPFGANPVKDDTASILKRIETETTAIKVSIACDPSFASFRKLLSLPLRQTPPSEFLQLLSLILLHDFACSPGNETADSLSYRYGSILCDDVLQGRMTARSHVALYLEKGWFVLTEECIHPCGKLVEWFVDGNMLLMWRLSEDTVRAYVASKRNRAAAPSSNGITEFVKALPAITPAQMETLLIDEGYVGQESARRIVCLSAYRHVQRLRKLFVDKVDPKTLPKRENLLCIGSTGSGKTYLVNILFEKILKLPATIVDATKFTEVGYVGDDVETILTRLLLRANGDIAIAQTGIACIDEIDKLAAVTRSRNVYGGEGTTKDVSGYGTQKGLLKLLEGSVVDTPVALGDFRCQRVPFHTGNVLFIGCGAFSGLDSIRASKPSIGFNNSANVNGDTQSANQNLSDDLFSYGLTPEFYGRFGQVTCFSDLSKDQLRHICEVSTVAVYRQELLLEGITLQISPAVIDILIDKALERRTGARGITAELVSVLSEAMFEVYSSNGMNRIIKVFSNSGTVQWAIHCKPTCKNIKKAIGAATTVNTGTTGTTVEQAPIHNLPQVS